MEYKRNLISYWSIYNLLSWIVGILLQFSMNFVDIESIRYNIWKLGLISDFHKPYFIESVFYYLPFGVSVSVGQLFVLRKKFKIHIGGWILATALGWSLFVAIFLETYEYLWKKDSSPYIIYLALIIVTLIGGFLIGSLQSLVLRKFLVRPILWILSNAFGLFILGATVLSIILLTFLSKNFILNILFSQNLDKLAFILYFMFLGVILLTFLFLGTFILTVLTEKNLNN